MKFTCDEL